MLCLRPANAQLGEQGVNRSHLQTRTPAFIAQIRGARVIVSVRNNIRKDIEPLDDLRAGSRARETVQQFLKHESGRVYRFTALERG